MQLTHTHITAKAVALKGTPAVASAVRVTPIGGTTQIQGVDFIVDGSMVRWCGYGMETLVAEGDRLLIEY